jgi:hypothetical protein
MTFLMLHLTPSRHFEEPRHRGAPLRHPTPTPLWKIDAGRSSRSAPSLPGRYARHIPTPLHPAHGRWRGSTNYIIYWARGVLLGNVPERILVLQDGLRLVRKGADKRPPRPPRSGARSAARIAIAGFPVKRLQGLAEALFNLGAEVPAKDQPGSVAQQHLKFAVRNRLQMHNRLDIYHARPVNAHKAE